MGKPVKIEFSFVAVVLYCLAVSMFSSGQVFSYKTDQKAETTASRIFVAEEIPFVAGFAIQEGTNYVFHTNTSSGTLKQLQLYKAASHVREVQVFSSVANYISRLLNFPVRIRKSDMLFPFHYFFETSLR
jgi:hypothetical protein